MAKADKSYIFDMQLFLLYHTEPDTELEKKR